MIIKKVMWLEKVGLMLKFKNLITPHLGLFFPISILMKALRNVEKF